MNVILTIQFKIVLMLVFIFKILMEICGEFLESFGDMIHVTWTIENNVKCRKVYLQGVLQ